MLPLLGIALGIWINPLDPLWTQSAFPWLWLAPTILALRYGPFPGLLASAVLLLAWVAFSYSGWLTGSFPKLNYLGGLILIMLCGESSSLWLSRARRAEGMQLYLDQRLEYLTHQYYLLRLSHDRLEQDLIGRPMAMRDALATLQELIKAHDATHSVTETSLPGADGLLRLLSQFCQLESATLHKMSSGVIDAVPTAALGASSDPVSFNPDDPLIRRALETGHLSHVAHELPAGENPSRYIIAAPLTTSTGEQLGLLLVEHVPFFALHNEMLQTLNLLLGYYTDGLITQQLAAPIRAALPDCPADFAAELQRLWRVRQESLVCSVIVALEFKSSAHFEDMALQIRLQRRMLDVSWLIEFAQHKVLVTLMPLAGNAAAEGYVTRIEDWVNRQSEQTLSEAGIFPHIAQLDEEEPIALIKRLLDLSHASPAARDLRADA